MALIWYYTTCCNAEKESQPQQDLCPACLCYLSELFSLHAGIFKNSQFAYPFRELKIVILTEDNIVLKVVATVRWIK